MGDKQKLLTLLDHFSEDAEFESIVIMYITRYGTDFSASRIQNLIERLNIRIHDKINDLEYAAKVSKTRALYLKQYLEGKMYTSEDAARRNIDAQISNAKEIIDAVGKVVL